MANAACDGGFITTASVEACAGVKDIISRLASRESEEEGDEETDGPTTADPETDAPAETETPVDETSSSSTRATIVPTETVDVTDPTEADEGEEDTEKTAPSTGFFEGRDAKWIAMFTSGCVAALVGITMFVVVSIPS